MSDAGPKYKRILLKLSGEALMGESSATDTRHASIDTATLERIAAEVMAQAGRAH